MASELLELEHQWAKALQSKDKQALEQLLAPEFRLSFVDDPRAPRTVPREDWFAMLDRMSFGECQFFESSEALFGNAAVLHFRCRFSDWTLDGRVLPSDYAITDVFVRRDGRWQVINRISEPTADAPKFWD